jgi:anti-sigma factor RsiW
MNCQRVQENFIDYQDNSLPGDEAAELRAHLASCPVCQREWSALQEISHKLSRLSETPKPSPRLREQFYAMLDTHQNEADAPSPFVFGHGRIDRLFAALLPKRPVFQFGLTAALLAGGIFIGQRYLAQPAPPAPIDSASRTELAALRAQMNSIGQLVTYSIQQQQSTSERMRAVLATMDLKSPDRKVLTDLVGSLAFDPSINVRLSVVEALSHHADDSLVRAGVLSALPRESAPLVQVAMIELLAGSRDEAAKPVFEKMSRDDAVDRNVREAARRALAALQQPDSSRSNRPAALKTNSSPVIS